MGVRFRRAIMWRWRDTTQPVGFATWCVVAYRLHAYVPYAHTFAGCTMDTQYACLALRALTHTHTRAIASVTCMRKRIKLWNILPNLIIAPALPNLMVAPARICSGNDEMESEQSPCHELVDVRVVIV